MFLKTLLNVLATKIFVLFIGFLMMILMVRGLGVEGRGVLAALLIYPQLLVSLFEGGMRQTATLYLGKKKELPECILGNLVIYGVIAGVIGFCVSFVIILYTSSINFTILLIIIASLVIPFQLFVAYLKGFFLGYKKFENVNKILYIPKVFVFLSLLLLYLYDNLTLMSVIVVTLIGHIVNFLQSFYYLRVTDVSFPIFNFRKTYLMFKSGIPYAIGLFLVIANYKLDVLLLGYWSNPIEIANYVIAVQLGELLWQLPAALVLILMAKSASEKDRQKFSSNIAMVCRLSFWVTLIFGIILFFLLPYMVDSLMGQGLESVPGIYLLLLPGLVFMVVFKSVNSDLAGGGSPKYSIITLLPCVLVNIGLNAWLIPIYGAKGAAIASSISYIFVVFALVLVHIQKYGQPLGHYFLLSFSDIKYFFEKVAFLVKNRR